MHSSRGATSSWSTLCSKGNKDFPCQAETHQLVGATSGTDCSEWDCRRGSGVLALVVDPESLVDIGLLPTTCSELCKRFIGSFVASHQLCAPNKGRKLHYG